jgi:hypothetical protein
MALLCVGGGDIEAPRCGYAQATSCYLPGSIPECLIPSEDSYREIEQGC